MRKYSTIFKIKFLAGLQYRTAAWAGIMTQFVWGFLEIKMFQAFYQTEPQSFPMTYSGIVTYVWLQQAFLSLYMLWFWENDLFEAIQNGNVAYELVRPVSIYNTWFVRNLATRVSKTCLRALPILVITFFLPPNYRLTFPSNSTQFLGFLLSIVLALLIVVSLSMLIYFWAFYTIQSLGLRMIFQTLGDLLTGAVIPLPFFPTLLQKMSLFFPFAFAQNIPFRVYSGEISGIAMIRSIQGQIFWIIILVGFGKWLEFRVKNRMTIQGG